MSVDSIIAEIEQLNVLDLVQLTKALQERWGVSAVPVAAAAGPAVATQEAAPAAPPAEEQTEFDAILTEVGPNKINVIKVVRELTGLGLKEAKAVVDEAQNPVKKLSLEKRLKRSPKRWPRAAQKSPSSNIAWVLLTGIPWAHQFGRVWQVL